MQTTTSSQHTAWTNLKVKIVIIQRQMLVLESPGIETLRHLVRPKAALIIEVAKETKKR